MELRHLRYFIAVAELLNFRRAADALNIAQPPLSMQIKALETELGVQLFDRTNRSISLTAAGKVFLDSAQRVLAEASLAKVQVKKAAVGITGQLTIGFMLSTDHDLLGQAVRTFKHQYPNVELCLLNLTNAEQVLALKENRIDIAFTRSRIDDAQLETQILFEEPMMLMVPSNDCLAKKARLRWRDLDSKSIITLPPTQALNYYDNFFSKCREANISVIKGQHANDIHTEMWLVSIGMGVSPTSFTASKIRRTNVTFCHLPSDLPKAQICMSWKRIPSTPVKNNFLSIIHKIISSS